MSQISAERRYDLRDRGVVFIDGESSDQTIQRFNSQAVPSKWIAYDQNPGSGKVRGPPLLRPCPITSPSNLCYQNALVQALFHVPKLANWLMFHHSTCHVQDACVACALRCLLATYWTLMAESSSVERTDASMALFRACQNSGDDGALGWPGQDVDVHRVEDAQEDVDVDGVQNAQEDVQEYWLYIYNAFKRQLTYGVNTDVPAAFSSMHIEYSWKCPGCGIERMNGEDGESLKLSFPDDGKSRYTLPDLLQHYFSPEQNSVDVTCDYASCRKKIHKQPRKLVMTVAPDVLVIHLVRFRQLFYGDIKKIETPVPFRQKLNMSPYYSGPRNSLRYHLVAVIQQQGDMQQGHYVTIARDPRGRWNRFNDHFTPERVSFRETCNPGKGFTPYLFFYKRIAQEKVSS